MRRRAFCFVFLIMLAAIAPRAEAQFVETTISSFATASTSYVNVTGGSLSFTPASSSDIWILLFSARLTSASTTPLGSVEARYLVNAVEHGMGGIYNSPIPSEGGSWQHFYRVTGTTAAQTVQVQLRDITGAGATIDDLHIIAFKLPPGADFHYTETDADTAAVNAWTVHETLNVTPSSPGTYLVFGLVNATEAPGSSTVAIRFQDPSPAYWPVEHVPGVQRWDYYINPSQVWQSFFVVRAESLAGPASYDLQVSGGTDPTATIRYRRLMAFRTDAFENFESAQDVSVSSTTSATPVVKSTLQTVEPPIARDYIVIQNLATVGMVGGSATVRQAAFETDDVVQVSYDRSEGSQYFATSYSLFDAMTADRSMKFENTFSTSNGDEVRGKESVIHVLRLPSTTYDGYELIGFETGDASELATLGPGAAVQGVTVRPGSGSFALQEGSTSTLTSGMTPPIDTFAMRFSFLKQTNPGALQTMVQLKNGASNLWSLGLTTTGQLRVQQNEALGLSATTGTTVFEDNRWYTVRIVYDRAAGGRLRVLVFETLDIDTTHSTGGSAVDAIDIAGSAGPNEFFYDDFFVASSSVRLPVGQIVRRGPNGAGASSGFDTRVGSGTPFQNVDEVAPGGAGDADYNSHAANNVATDLYAMQDGAPGPINAVKGMWRMQRGSGGGAGTHDYAWREGGTTASTEFVGLGAAYQTTEEIWSAPPVSGSSWTASKLNALELGASHNGTLSQDTFISWTVAMVDYRPVANYRSIGTNGAYVAGTVGVATGAYAVHGSSTTWLSANRGRGDRIQIDGSDYTIASVSSETELTLTSPFEGVTGSGKAYTISRQYTLLQDWSDCVTGTPASCTFFPIVGSDLVAENRSEVGIAYDDTAFTADVLIDGSTTDANHRITLTADDGNRHYGIPGQGVLLDASALLVDAIRVRDDFVTVQWFEVSGGGDPGSDGVHVRNQLVSNHVVVRNMLVHGQPQYGILTTNVDLVVDIYNNIVYNSDRGIGVNATLNANAQVRILNNTVYNSASTGAITSAGGANVVLLQNNISHTTNGGAGNDYAVPNLDANSSHNLASDTTGISHSPVTGGQDSVSLAAVSFFNEPARDLHINPASVAANAAADLSNVFTFDVDGGTRVTTWDIGADDVAATTEVELLSFTASGADEAIDLRWETGSELNNLGFHLYRAVAEDGPYERITTHVMPGLGSSPAGASYSYRDGGLTNGKPYFYKLEDIETTGRVELHGPIAAVPQGGDVASTTRNPEGVEPGATSLITYGNPLENHYRVLERGPRHVTLELVTQGFYAEPREDGTVVVTIPGFESSAGEGTPSIPVKRHWLEVPGGADVEVLSVRARGVETVSSWPLAGAELHELTASAVGTVRLARGRRRRVESKEGLYPAAAARVLSVGFQQDAQKAHLELAPVRWDATTGDLWFTRRLVVRLAFRHSARDVTSRRRQRDPVIFRLATKRDGLYELRYEDVFERGRGVAANELRLTRHGETVPFHIEPARRRFHSGSRLYFLSKGEAANPYGDEAVFELEIGAGGTSMDVRSAAASGEAVPSFSVRTEREENRFYQAALVDAPDLWLWDVLIAPSTKRYPFVVSGLAQASSSSRLSVDLQGVSDTVAAPDHHIGAYINGSWVGEIRWNGKQARALEVEIPTSLLHEGDNELALENVGDTDAAFSMVMLNRFSVVHPQIGLAEGARFEGRASRSGAASVSALGGPAFVLDVTETAPVWLENVNRSVNGSLQFRVESEREYLVVGKEAILRPVLRRARRPRLFDPKRGANYLVIAPRAFLTTAEPLLELRRGQGLAAQSVAVEDIYAEFGFGEARPEAIRDFIAHVFHDWPLPALRYVLLLGDGTYDFKDYLGTGAHNQLPPLVTRTSYLWTASDPTLAAVHGDDLLPDVAIGRIPASDTEELGRYVEKILAFEALVQAPSTASGAFVIVADDPDSAGDFTGNADDIAAGVLASRAIRRLSLETLAPATVRNEIQRSFDDGASLVSYVGHGGIHLWADENIFNIQDVDALAHQPLQPFVVTMNCLNGYFHFPFFDSLAEKLLLARGRGAIAVFSPSGLSRDDPAHQFHQLLLDAVYNAPHERLGDAILAAQSAYAETGAFPELLSIYHLFGDPALRLR